VSDITDGFIQVTVCVAKHETDIMAVTNVLCVICNIFCLECRFLSQKF